MSVVKLEKPLRRLVQIAGQDVIVELVPAEGNHPAHLTLKVPGAFNPYWTTDLESPPEAAGGRK